MPAPLTAAHGAADPDAEARPADGRPATQRRVPHHELELFADFDERYGPTSLATAVLLGLWLLLTHAAAEVEGIISRPRRSPVP